MLAVALLAAILAAQAAPPAGSPPASPPGTPAPKPPNSSTPVKPALAAPPAATPGPGPTISGRPPEPPLKRYEPRLWEMKLEANIYLAPTVRYETAPLQLRSVIAWVPIIVQNTWSQTDPDSVHAQLFVQGQPVKNIADRLTWRHQLPFGMAAIGLAVGDVSGQSLRWNMSWRVQVWNTQLDDSAAAAIAWPQEWPAEVEAALHPQPGIESDAPEFLAFVQRVSKGKLRAVTPYIAAKELVKATILSFKTIDNTGLRLENGFTRGLLLQGAHDAMMNGNGSSHDMVAACVAVLRAAGIPARPVVGAADTASSSGVSRTRLVTWAEFYLPGTGWVPFDPLELRGRVTALPDSTKPWPNFGSWDDLNLRVPLSFAWSAPVPGSTSLPYPAVWSWTASGAMASNGMAQDMIGLQIISRGRVPE